MAADTERVEPGESEEEVEDVYEVERIIDMRVEEGEVLYRVRWKNYCSDDDTWEPEAHLEDCREVLLAFKKNITEAKSKKEAEAKKSVKVLPAKSDLFNADSDSDKDPPTDLPLKKKKKQHVEELPPKEKKKKKKKERRQEDFRPLPAPETDEEDEPATTPPSSPKKRQAHSDEDPQDPVPAKKHKKDKGKEVPKAKPKDEEAKKKKGRKEVRMDTSDDDTAPIEEDISESPSEAPTEVTTSEALRTAQSIYLDDKFKEKKGKWEVKLQGFKNLIQKKDSKKPDALPKENSLQKLKSLTSKAKDDLAPHSSDSSDSSTAHRKSKSKDRALAPSSASVTPSTRPKEDRPKEDRPKEDRPKEDRPKEDRPKEDRPKEDRPKEDRPKEDRPKEDRPKEDRPKEDRPKEDRPKEDRPKEDTQTLKDATGSTNLFEKFLLNCEAKDRAPRRPAPHQLPPEKNASKPFKLIGKIERIPKSSKESPVQKADAERTDKLKQTEAICKASQSHGFSLDSDEREGEFSPKNRAGDEARRERTDEGQRSGWDRHSSTARRREDSEPRLFMACEEPPEDLSEPSDKTEKTQATLSLGMDLNLDWMTLEDFQRHLNGDDEVLSGPPLSPSELRDAVKSGDYLAVKLALNSKEDYNLDQEDGSGMSLSMLAAAGGQDDILRLLIRKGVKVNGRQKNGTTALMHAAEKNFLTTVAILLEAGAYVNAQTLGGETALMKACKRGNLDVVRLLLEYGADCNIMSKHGKNTAMYFAKLGNNLMVCDLIKDHTSMLCSVTDEVIRAYFESRLAVLEPVFPLACHRLCEGPDFYMEFGYKLQPQPEGSGILLFIFHANFQNEITARLCGPCAVHAVVLNDKFQLPIFLDSHFIYSFSPVPGINKLFIRLAESPTAKVKLLISAYKVQLQGTF
ncbi:M-phase phosphoprotein 8 isoform X3 [Periophthalmus magnuspinnatus]|uniref:M-phase phosphoprotein 8 isoform X3 n=1 Tax=Periophthalmus magnuspinnatus TaxID=409849 RepID=UPI00145B76FE|nr:M-phase phosphoprotein 8 isoform X3 [Periophthalmus magnuspinnatus]